MDKILQKHPDLQGFLTSDMKRYRVIDGDKLIEMWEKDENGHWIDVTERELAKQELAAAVEELEKLNQKEQKHGTKKPTE